jgi:ATP-binding cassette subfamily F protein 3
MLRATGLSKAFGGRSLFKELDLHVRPRDRIGLVGRNGEGKTTLLRILADVETADDGQVVLRRNAEVGYLRQEVDPHSPRSAIDETRTALSFLAEIEAEITRTEAEIAVAGERGEAVPKALAERYDLLRTRFERGGGFEAESRLRETLSGLGLGATRWDAPLNTLSGGWLMRVELAKLLLRRPDVLLLDEPTNHLDLPSIAWFESVLASYPGAVIVVSHDRAFLDRHVERILELEVGRATTYVGGYNAYVEAKAQRELELEARRRNLDRKIAHVESFVKRFGAKATKATLVNSRKKMLERLRAERAEAEPTARAGRAMRVRFPDPPRSGERALRLAGIAKAFGETRVYTSLDLEVRRGDRVALIGPNGAGKSTLLRLSAGVLPPDAGVREPGHNVHMAFYAQHALDALDPHRSVFEEIERDAPTALVPRLRGLLGAFLFSGDDIDKRVSVLSGGEKARLALARLLLQRANFLVLDEPTNHLDIHAQDVLIEALRGFGGTLMFISHDRTFINALANRVVEVTPGESGAQVRSFPGNYDDYERALARATEGVADTARRDGAKRGPSPARRRPKAMFTLRRLESRSNDLEAEIESTESELERNGWLSAEPGTASDGERMRALSEERQGLEATLAQLYADWEQTHVELEDFRGRAPNGARGGASPED